MTAIDHLNLSKNLVSPLLTELIISFAEEGEGFEPSRHPSAPSALAVRCNRPLCQPSERFISRRVHGARQRRVRDSNPQDLSATPVFETGALPVRLTLR